MYLIQDILVSDEILEARFACDTDACKGACCWEGDFGAPLEAEEVPILNAEWPAIRPFLQPGGRQEIERVGVAVHYPQLGKEGTSLVDGGPCAFLSFDKQGVAQCGIELAWQAGATTFRKPVSCHLYPIRVSGDPGKGMLALNYDQWSICDPACARGESEEITLVDFLQEALERRFGTAFTSDLRTASLEHNRRRNSPPTVT